MSDSYKVIYSPEALDDIRNIYSQIAFELKVPGTAQIRMQKALLNLKNNAKGTAKFQLFLFLRLNFNLIQLFAIDPCLRLGIKNAMLIQHSFHFLFHGQVLRVDGPGDSSSAKWSYAKGMPISSIIKINLSMYLSSQRLFDFRFHPLLEKKSRSFFISGKGDFS